MRSPGLFRRMARDRPLAVVLDDLHWAQLPTLALLEHVIHSSLDTPILVLGTFRTHRPGPVRRASAPGSPTCTGWTACAGSTWAASTPTPSRSSSASTPGCRRPGRRASAAILRDRTGGNPFFLRETWLDLERRGGWRRCAARSGCRPPSATPLAARLAGLGDRVREIIELAAVLGDHFDLPTLVRAGASDRGQSMDAVDSATAVGLIEAVDGVPGRYGFVHSLTRQAVLDRLPHARRTWLHARVAQALEALRDPALIPRIAHHYLAAHLLGYHDQALRYAVAGGSAGRAQPGLRGGGHVVRPGRDAAGDRGRRPGGAVVRRRARTTCAPATSPGPG